MKRGHTPERMCVICRERAPQHMLTRHTLNDGRLVVDTDSRTQGRGWYVCTNAACREKFARYRAGGRKSKAARPQRAG